MTSWRGGLSIYWELGKLINTGVINSPIRSAKDIYYGRSEQKGWNL